MSIIRLYTGPDGQTHIEALDPASHPLLTSPQATTNIVFRTAEPGRFSDWHNAPRRQYVINLAGEVEIGLGDGTGALLWPGSCDPGRRSDWQRPYHPCGRERATRIGHDLPLAD